MTVSPDMSHSNQAQRLAGDLVVFDLVNRVIIISIPRGY